MHAPIQEDLMDLPRHRLALETGFAAVDVELAHQLIESFTWAESPEGHGYWEARFWELLGLADRPDAASTST